MAYLPLDQVMITNKLFGSYMYPVLATSSGDTASFVTRSSDGTLLVVDTAPGYLSITGAAASDSYITEVVGQLNAVAFYNPGQLSTSRAPSEVSTGVVYTPVDGDVDKGNLATVLYASSSDGSSGGSYTIYVHASETWPTF